MGVVSLEPRRLGALHEDLASGRLMLFTGAGFPADARDRPGRSIPTGKELRDELWSLCFPDEEPDDSVLSDLFFHALSRCRDDPDDQARG